jgi:hypothetical protein
MRGHTYDLEHLAAMLGRAASWKSERRLRSTEKEDRRRGCGEGIAEVRGREETAGGGSRRAPRTASDRYTANYRKRPLAQPAILYPMKVVIRTIESAEIGTNPWASIARLRPIVNPGWPRAHDVYWHSAFWRWLESHPLANEMHRWVVVVDGDRVVGHLAAVPLYYRINGQRVVAHTPADYRVLPKYGFHAILLMRTLFRTCQNCVTCDIVPAVINVQTRLGAEEVGKLQNAMKLLDVSGIPSSMPISNPITRLLDRGLRAIDEMLTTGLEEDLEVGVLERFDESFDELFEKIAAVVPCLPEKDAAFLNWRYGPGSPQSGVTILGARGEEGILGYAVLSASVVERANFILDLTTLPGRRDVSRALLKEAVRHFRQTNETYPMVYRSLESPTSFHREDLWRLGGFFRRDGRYTLMLKFADSGLHKVASDSANWTYNIGDSENSFWE